MANNNPLNTHKTILYIEDDHLSALLVERVLRVYGYKIVHKTTALEGLAVTESLRPVLILVDIHLPDMDGRALAAQLRTYEHLQDIPIVALTSYRGLEVKRSSFTSGFDGYITKPIDTKELPAQIEPFLKGQWKSGSRAEEATYLPAYNAQLMEKLEQRVQELTETNQTLLDLEKQNHHFLMAIAGQLRSPCFAIKGYVDSFLNNAFGDLNFEQRDALEAVAKDIDELTNLLENLLYYDEIKTNSLTLAYEYFDFYHLMAEIAAVFHASLQNGKQTVTFDCRTDADLPKVYADQNRIKQVILNLLHKAVKFTNEGEVSLSATVKDDNLEINISGTRQRLVKGAINYLSDESSPPNQVFPAEDNADIGLLISKHLIEAHKGDIWVSADSGSGLHFSFTIPFGQPSLAEQNLLPV